eukprot:m.167006 g.167006  ORF g.167006 m.167006 type:complete len:111 (-) comp15300_c0_seq2:1311-1643(-)
MLNTTAATSVTELILYGARNAPPWQAFSENIQIGLLRIAPLAGFARLCELLTSWSRIPRSTEFDVSGSKDSNLKCSAPYLPQESICCKNETSCAKHTFQQPSSDYVKYSL